MVRSGYATSDQPSSRHPCDAAHQFHGVELLERSARQAAFYGVSITREWIDGVEKTPEGFVAKSDEGEVSARTILLATGMDIAPEMEGLDEAVKTGLVRYCLVFDAFEASD
jgi:thioredoxin reductase (NADPH)